MEKIKGLFRSKVQIGAFALLIFALALLCRTVANNSQPASQIEATQISPYPAVAEIPAVTNEPYPPPGGDEVGFPLLPGKVASLTGLGSLLDRVTTATLVDGNIWVITPDHKARSLELGFNDVSEIYGWNYNGTKLLFGRGLYPTSGEMAPTTELWVFDINDNTSHRVIENTRAWAAGWSPVDDRIAYCEYGDDPVIVVLSAYGEVIAKQEHLYTGFSWSPDGSAIAATYSGPEHVEFDTRYSVLAIWQLEKDDLQLSSKATREDHSNPIWLMDGTSILFTRIFGPGSEEGKSGLYLVDTSNMQIEMAPYSPEYIVNRMQRSPRADILVYRLGYEVYVMEYGKPPVLIGKGDKPAWLPDGKTVIYLDENGNIQSYVLDIPLSNKQVGGGIGHSTMILQPQFFFTIGDEP